MFTRDDLRAAVGQDVITAAQAARLEAFIASRRAEAEGRTGPAGGESLRFLANFNDIFITVGIGVLFAGLSAVIGTVFLGDARDPDTASWGGLVSSALLAGAALVMMEYFCARRRLLLPSMALSLIFVACVIAAAFSVAAGALSENAFAAVFDVFANPGRAAALGFGAGLAAALLIYWRYRLPFSMLLIGGSAAGLAYSLLAAGVGMEALSAMAGPLVLLVGVATLGAAVAFDFRDPQRLSLSSDNAFWLHMAAAPQIVFGLSLSITYGDGLESAGQAAVLLAALLAFGTLSLALNRRALIFAGLLSFATAVFYLTDEAGLGGLGAFSVAALLIGGGVVLLGGGWSTARRGLLALLPRGGAWGRLFPAEPA